MNVPTDFWEIFVPWFLHEENEYQGQVTPAKVMSIQGVDLTPKFYFVRLRNSNSCNISSIYDFPGALLTTSYTLQFSQGYCSVMTSFNRPGKKGLERLNSHLCHSKSWVFLLFISACPESTHYLKSN